MIVSTTDNAVEPRVRLLFLGAPRVEYSGQQVKGFESRKAIVLLGYLAAHVDAIPRSELATLFWSNQPNERARGNLRRVLHNLATLLPGCLEADRQTVRLVGAPACWIDTIAFDALVAQGTLTALTSAAELYRGPFLDGLYLDDCPDVETWLAQERERWHECIVNLLADLVTRSHERREWTAGLRYVDRLLTLDPWREAAHQDKMRLLALSGQRDTALAQYETCRRILSDELGINPSLETTTLYEQIRDGMLMPSAAVVAQRFPIPLPSTPLLGRVGELAQLTQLLAQTGCRLLTLLGPGGVGKTRLALEVVTQQQAHFDDGVCMVELASIHDPALVAPTIAQALAVSENGERSIVERLKTWLRDKHLLLYLDNFEQILAAAPLVRELLASSPQLKILVSSRTPLHVQGEQEFLVSPLALPDPQHLRTQVEDRVAVLTHYAATALFVERSHSIKSDFTVTHANAPLIAEICARLDGLPLAIELAAARIKIFSPPVLLARLEQRLPLLTGGARDLPVRQRTLRDTIAWSYQLLAPAEQRLFRDLSVCIGGCTLETVEAIVADWLPTAPELLGILATLIDNSLLRQEVGHDDTVRLVMLETIREYALEILAASGELPELQRRHAQTFLALAETAKPHLQDQQQEVWLDRLEIEYDNLRAALEWSRAPDGDGLLGLQLAEALWEFWLVRGYVSEGRGWIDVILDLPDTQAPLLKRARLLDGGGRLAWAQNDWQQATNLLEASRLLCTSLSDTAGCASALNHLAEVAEAQGDYDRAAALFTQSLDLFREVGNREGSASVLVVYGQMMLLQGQHKHAAELIDAGLILYEELGDQRGLAGALTVQGQIMHKLGEYMRAEQLFSQSLGLFRSLGYRHGIGWALTNQGQMLLEQGEYVRAEQLFAQSLALYQELDDQRGQAWALTNQGQAAHDQGNYAHALALLERSVALFNILGDQRGYAWAAYHVGHSLCAQGNYEQAARRFSQSLQIFQALEDVSYSVACLSGLADVCIGLGQQRIAVRFLAAADTLRTNSRIASTIAEDTTSMIALHQSLDVAMFAAEWQAGSSMTVEQALNWASHVLFSSSVGA